MMHTVQTGLDFTLDSEPAIVDDNHLLTEIANFDGYGKKTIVTSTNGSNGNTTSLNVDTFVNEFWTSKQRAANSLHEISYRACFKPQLPRFFINRLTTPFETVYDPFMGRGTTLLEAALLRRIPYGCDINPLSKMLLRPRLNPPSLDDVARRLKDIPLHASDISNDSLLAFFHEDTLREIEALRAYLLNRDANDELDRIDDWIRMVAINRLTGHSRGFFSVYTLPPNQAVTIEAQRKINERRKQTPEYRDVRLLILRKTRTLLKDCDAHTILTLRDVAASANLCTADAAQAVDIPNASVSLVVTSPPFLDVVNYPQDNWLRCWFAEINPDSVTITMSKKLERWQSKMTDVLEDLRRIVKPRGYIAFEVGEVRNSTIKLEETVLTCGTDVGLKPVLVLINDQRFTKTSHSWGVANETKGTNTNRIVLFRNP